MKEKDIALTFINRIGLKSIKNNEIFESIKNCLLNYEVKSTNSSHIPESTTFQPELEKKGSKKAVSFITESSINKLTSSQDEKLIQVQLLQHLAYLRNETNNSTHDSLLNDDLKSKSLLLFSKNLLTEFKRNSSWYSILDDKSEDDPEYSLDGIDRLFALVIALLRLEKYTNSESSVVSLLSNNILFSFRYTFQSESSNLSVIQHPEWAIDYMKSCVIKYMSLFKRIKNDLKLDCSKYFSSLVPEPYSSDPSLLEEFSLLCKEVSMDELISDWCLLLAKETRLFVYSRLPFLVYDYFLENDDNRLVLTNLTRIISSSNSSVLEVSRSTFEDDKVNSVIYSMLNSLVNFGLYLKNYSNVSSFELFSDFDHNTLIPFIVVQIYHYKNGLNSEGELTQDQLNLLDKKDELIDMDDGKRADCVERKITLCFDSNILFGCLDFLLDMENAHVMRVLKRVLSLESFTESIGVRSGFTAEMYLQDDQFFSQISNLLISVLNQIELRCQCLRLLDSKKRYVSTVVVPMLEFFVDSVKHIWNSLDSVLDSCTISCLLLECVTFLHEFLLKFPLYELLTSSISSLENITQKMVAIFDQYFVELYYDSFKNVHKQELEIVHIISDKLLQICALTSYKNYKRILTTTLGSMEKMLVSTLIPTRTIDFIFEGEEDVEIGRRNCEFILECVKNLVDPKDFKDSMPQVQDMIVILSMENVELNTSAEYLNLLGTTSISGKKPNNEKNDRESPSNQWLKQISSDSFVSSVIFDDFESDFKDGINDSLIVSKIKDKLKLLPLTTSHSKSRDSLLISVHFSYMIDSTVNIRNVPHVDGNYHTLCYIKVEISKEISSIAKKAYNTLFNLEKLNNVLISEQPTQADSDYTYSDTDMDLDSQINSTRTSPSYAHLSLCKPLYLRKQFIDPFLEKLKNTLQNVKPFYLVLENKVSICANDHLNRYFAVSFVDKACCDNTVLPIIDRVDQVVDSFGFEKYYEQRKPHVSFASTRDLSLVLDELYRASDPSGGSHSTNYWTNLDHFLEKCDNLPQESVNFYDATSVNYTFTFQGSDLDDTSLNNDDKICLYVDEIHVLVGSRDHVVKLE